MCAGELALVLTYPMFNLVFNPVTGLVWPPTPKG